MLGSDMGSMTCWIAHILAHLQCAKKLRISPTCSSVWALLEAKKNKIHSLLLANDIGKLKTALTKN